VYAHVQVAIPDMAEAVGDADILILGCHIRYVPVGLDQHNPPFSIFIASTPPKLNSVFGVVMAVFTALNLLYI